MGEGDPVQEEGGGDANLKAEKYNVVSLFLFLFKWFYFFQQHVNYATNLRDIWTKKPYNTRFSHAQL